MTEYKFTQDWFHWAPEVWTQLIPLLPDRIGKRGREFLEIGSFEGRSMVWIVENMMQEGDSLCCIDTWAGGEEHVNGEMDEAEGLFDYNLDRVQEKFPERYVYKYKGTSVQQLAHWLVEEPDDNMDIDFIYIDGSHIARDVLTDACMAWPLLKKGGIMVFDDYLWGEPRDILHRPKPAIDAFVNIFAEEVDMVHMGYQLIVRKK